jgi:hypothetical protein
MKEKFLHFPNFTKQIILVSIIFVTNNFVFSRPSSSPARSSGSNPSISFSKSAPGEVQLNLDKIMSNKKAAAINWQERGGPGRDHDVLMEFQFNKVGFIITAS